MTKVIQLTRVSPTPTEESVTGPYKPQAHDVWTNSLPQVMPGENIRKVRLQVVTNPPVMIQPRLPRIAEQKKDFPIWKKIAIALGALSVSVGTIAGLISMAWLGPFGLLVSAGAIVVGGLLLTAARE